MPPPRFSVVIPTRNRAHYLQASIGTVLNQTFKDYEVVVCDNCSPPETRQVAASFHTDQVKYFRSDTPLAMTHNWELALSKAQGEYVIIIGDDDGLLPHALEALDSLLAATKADACTWRTVLYYWPDMLEEPNYCTIPIGQGYRPLPSQQKIRQVLDGKCTYQELPGVYHGVVHRSVLAEIQAKGGRVFDSLSPDIYSAFAIAYVAKKPLVSQVPMSIIGISRGSNGYSSIVNTHNPTVAKDFSTLNGKEGLRQDPTLPAIPLMYVYTVDGFLHSKARLFPHDAALSIGRKRIALECLARIGELSAKGTALEPHLRELETKFADFAFVKQRVERERKRISNVVGYIEKLPPHVKRQPALSPHALTLDLSEFGVVDVQGAAALAEKILNYTRTKIEWTNGRAGGFKAFVKDLIPPAVYRLLLPRYVDYLHWKSRQRA